MRRASLMNRAMNFTKVFGNVLVVTFHPLDLSIRAICVIVIGVEDIINLSPTRCSFSKASACIHATSLTSTGAKLIFGKPGYELLIMDSIILNEVPDEPLCNGPNITLGFTVVNFASGFSSINFQAAFSARVLLFVYAETFCSISVQFSCV